VNFKLKKDSLLEDSSHDQTHLENALGSMRTENNNQETIEKIVGL